MEQNNGNYGNPRTGTSYFWPILLGGLLMHVLMLSRADHQALSVSVIEAPRGWRVSLWLTGHLMPPDPGCGVPDPVWMNCQRFLAGNQFRSVSLDGMTIHQQNYGWIFWTEQAYLPVNVPALIRHHKILTSKYDAVRIAVRLWQINQPVLYSTSPGHYLINQQTQAQEPDSLTDLPVTDDDARQSVCWSEPYNPYGSDDDVLLNPDQAIRTGLAG